MAKGIMKLAKADIGLSITGIAGPSGGTDEKPVGLVYLGLAAADNFYAGRTLRLGKKSSRSEIRFRAANEALNMVRLYLIDSAVLGGQSEASQVQAKPN
jgi:nicotinamide-nucleotide amidase